MPKRKFAGNNVQIEKQFESSLTLKMLCFLWVKFGDFYRVA